jgi:hypothetical protein
MRTVEAASEDTNIAGAGRMGPRVSAEEDGWIEAEIEAEGERAIDGEAMSASSTRNGSASEESNGEGDCTWEQESEEEVDLYGEQLVDEEAEVREVCGYGRAGRAGFHVKQLRGHDKVSMYKL